MVNLQFSRQLDLIGEHLAQIGYREPFGKTVFNYEFTINRSQKANADILAFADPRQLDISTACIAVKSWPNGDRKQSVLEELRYVGAPLALFAHKDHVELWRVSAAVPLIVDDPLTSWTYDQFDDRFHKYQRDLNPQSLLEAKKTGRQLSFFAIDPSLEEFARQATQETLVQQFVAALNNVPDRIRSLYPKALTRVAISVLAARILQDKLVSDEEIQTRDVLELLDALRVRFPRYFNNLEPAIEQTGIEVVYSLYDDLLGEFTFRSLTNDMLAYFYENTFVDSNLRRELGIYYTPRHITERILKHLPVEDLPLENRTVMDGTSGSGNMLLAACQRLRELLPVSWSLEDRHQYLLDHIFGIDADPFATEIARLSLLLYDLPAGNHWQVETGDILEMNPRDSFGIVPHIVVSNPPFREEVGTGAGRIQMAAEVLKKYLDILPPDGLIGIVLPLTFLNSENVADVRELLLSCCDVLEVWHFLEGAISHWTTSTAVILARKLAGSVDDTEKLVRVIEVSGTDGSRFEQTGTPTFSYTVPRQRWLESSDFGMMSSPLHSICHRLDSEFPPLEPTYAQVRNGVQPGKQARDTHFGYKPQGDMSRKTLYDNADGTILEPYHIDWHSQIKRYIRYPGALRRRGVASHFNMPTKVIINGTRNSGGPWRLFAAVDREQLIPTENFHYAVLTGEVTAEEVAAVINSPVANAWFANRVQGMNIPTNVLRQIPFPGFSQEDRERIEYLVRSIEFLKELGEEPDLEQVRLYTDELDDIVFDAYHFRDDEREHLTRWINHSSRPRPGREWSDAGIEHVTEEQIPVEPFNGPVWLITGRVIQINADSATVVLSVDGEEAEIPIPPNMPGWALRPSVLFEAQIPWEQASYTDLSSIAWQDFEPVGYNYLTEQELISLINSSIRKN